MAEDWPKIKACRTTRVSGWMAIIEREVEFAPGAERETLSRGRPAGLHRHYRALRDGRIPIVGQYRPALESFTGNCLLGSSTR